MALNISLGRGLVRAAISPETLPSMADMNAKMLQDFKQAYGDIDLARNQDLGTWQPFINDTAQKQEQGVYETFAPYNGSMEKVFVDKAGAYPLTWCWSGRLCAITANGFKSIGIAELDANVIATID